MLIKDILINAQESIRNPEKWFNAKTPLEDRINRQCAAFAVSAASKHLHKLRTLDLALEPLWKVIGKIPENGFMKDLFAYNDSHSHEEVMIWFDQAIAIAEGEVE